MFFFVFACSELLVSRCLFLRVGCIYFDCCLLVFVVRGSLFVVRCFLFCVLLFVVCCVLIVVCCLLSIVCCLFVVRFAVCCSFVV